MGATLFVVYMLVFPAMQFVYKQQVAADKGKGKKSRLAQEEEEESNSASDISDPERTPLLRRQEVSHARMAESSVTQAGSNAGDSIRKDLAFFAMGTLLLAVESTLIAVFDTQVILFIGKKC